MWTAAPLFLCRLRRVVDRQACGAGRVICLSRFAARWVAVATAGRRPWPAAGGGLAITMRRILRRLGSLGVLSRLHRGSNLDRSRQLGAAPGCDRLRRAWRAWAGVVAS